MFSLQANSNKDSCLMALVELYNATFDGRARYTVFVQVEPGVASATP